VLTDSGGIQEETTILGIPCLTLRDNTERPITVKEGTNFLVGNDPDRIMRTALRILRKKCYPPKKPRYWDGKTARRIVTILKARLL
jgi:UDP-N-acetylglucosamine 2-epimerase (non-hydrolysing)